MILSVIVPCYNEEHNIEAIMKAIQDVPVSKEIIIVDDGSTDKTTEILEKVERSGLVTKIHYSRVNFGKGSAIRIGLKYVTGDIVIIQDADLEYDPRQLPALIQPILDGKADVVYGSRFRGSIAGMHFANRVANRVLTGFTNLPFLTQLTDEATCYKAFRATVIRSINLTCRGFEFCPEITAKVLKKGIRIQEGPIRYVGRTVSEGKKVKWADALVAMWTLLKYRFCD